MKYRVKNSKIAIILSIIIMLIGIIKNEVLANIVFNNNEEETILAYNIETNDEINIITEFINNNNDLFSFYADTFAIDIKDIEEQLILANSEKVFNINDIAATNNNYDSLDKNIIDYLFMLEDEKPQLFNNKIHKNTMSSEYIYNLLNYYCGIYDVDYQVLASIAYIESGNLKAKSMLRKNNIYGGMANKNTLIAYKNISYGVLSYVKLMKNKYYNKGLNTIEKIGFVYNPIIINGQKVVNPEWLNNVTNTLSKFDKNIIINDISQLNANE